MSKKINGATKSLETIPMDVVVLNILVFVHPHFFFPNYSSVSEKSINDYYGYFQRDRTRKIYYLYRVFYVQQFREYRHVFNIEKANDLSLVVPQEDELTQKFFSNSHRTRSLRRLTLGIRRHNPGLLSRAFAKESCFPNLCEFRIWIYELPDFFSPVKFPSRLRKQLQQFIFAVKVTSSDDPQIRFEFPLILDTPCLDNLMILHLEHVNPIQSLVLKTPNLRVLILKHCDNISLETGKELEEFEFSGMKADFIKKLDISLNTSSLRILTITTGVVDEPGDFTFLFDGQEGRTPLKKFRRLEQITFHDEVEWNNELLGENERIFPNESLEYVYIKSCKSLKRHHVNWSSEKLEKIRLYSVPLCLDPKVDLKNVKTLMLRNIEGLTYDFFREAKFEKLETIVIVTVGLSFLSGVGWDESFGRKLKVLSLYNVDANNVLSSGDFLSLEKIILGRNCTKATKWGNLPSLRKIECFEEFYESLKECNTEGNIDFGRLEWEEW